MRPSRVRKYNNYFITSKIDEKKSSTEIIFGVKFENKLNWKQRRYDSYSPNFIILFFSLVRRK